MIVIDQHDIRDTGEGSMSRDVQDDNDIVMLSEHEEQHGNLLFFYQFGTSTCMLYKTCICFNSFI